MPFKAKRRINNLFCLLLLALPVFSLGQPPPAGPDSVVVVANSAMEGSLKVAQAYMERRGIPEDNLIILETATQEHIPRGVYLETIHNPIMKTLLERDLIDAFEGQIDELGRKTVTVFTNKVRYMVLCYGIPTKVQNVDAAARIADEAFLVKTFKRRRPDLLKSFSEGNLSRTEASVDGELAIMLKRDLPIRGAIPNPLYQQANPPRQPDLLRVTRLDGPSPKAVIRMLDNALAGEKNGLRGRAYVDQDGRKGGYLTGNEWMERAAELFDSLGFDLERNNERATFRPADRFDAPVLYAGWYAGNCNGPFMLPEFRFPEGAVAVHLHSFSASRLRSEDRGWVGPLVNRGVSATVGNVAEPYLRMTHNFDLLFAALSKGWNFGDAAYFAQPFLSWQQVAIGDPLYRPFSKSHADQLEAIGAPANILEDQYVVIRQINLLLDEGKKAEARRLASRAMRDTPGAALALLRAQLLIEEGDPKEAQKCLSLIGQLPPSSPMDWGLFAKIADTLVALGDARTGLQIYRNLERENMPEDLKRAFLERGVVAAIEAGETGLAVDWKARSAPPPNPETETTPVDKT